MACACIQGHSRKTMVLNSAGGGGQKGLRICKRLRMAKRRNLSGPISRDTAILSLHIARYCDTFAAIPNIRRYFLGEVSTPP